MTLETLQQQLGILTSSLFPGRTSPCLALVAVDIVTCFAEYCLLLASMNDNNASEADNPDENRIVSQSVGRNVEAIDTPPMHCSLK